MSAKSTALTITGALSIVASLVIGNAASSATNDDRPTTLRAHVTFTRTLTATTNPFASLTDPHKNVAIVEKKAITSGGSVPGPSKAGSPSTMASAGPAEEPASVLLCNTWAVDPNDKSHADRTPVAVFAVGNQPIVAAPNDDVGGYILSKVEIDNVQFATGEVLTTSDCTRALAPAQTTTEALQPQNSSWPSPSLGQFPQGADTSRQVQPPINGTAPVVNPLNSTAIDSSYSSTVQSSGRPTTDPSSYAGNVYGATPPSPQPNQQNPFPNGRPGYSPAPLPH